jgi:hypothetical protein
MQGNSKPDKSAPIRRAWNRPELKVADVKEITAGPSGSGTEGGPNMRMHSPSDARLKRNVERLGSSPSGLPIYRFEYVWGSAPSIGVMAQDLLKSRPDAVHKTELGFYVVDYSQIDVEPNDLVA